MELSFRMTEADIAQALRRRFEKTTEELTALSITTLSDAELASFVHEIVQLGRTHGFVLRGDLYSLAEAAAVYGRDDVLVDIVLTNPDLSAQEKVCVIVDLCKETRSSEQTRRP